VPETNALSGSKIDIAMTRGSDRTAERSMAAPRQAQLFGGRRGGAAASPLGAATRYGAPSIGRGLLLGALSIAAGLVLWELIASFLPRMILPPPSAVADVFTDPVAFAKFAAALQGSLTHLALGFGLALAVAVPLGILIGRSATLTAMFEPVIIALYAIPPVTFVPFLIIWFGLFLEARVALVFMMSVFDVLVIVLAGARDVRPMLLDVGRSFGAGSGQRLRLIVLPALTPFLFAAARVGSARAINGMITAELFFAAVYLGGILKQASQNFDTARAIAVVVVICLLGLLVQTLIGLLEARIAHWYVRDAR
jgi:ABC-type nitrate/sulfonate/bicarbonate transport system permease component